MSTAKGAYLLAKADDQNAELGVEYARKELTKHKKYLEDLATSFIAGTLVVADYLEEVEVHRRALCSAEEALYTRFIVRKQQTAAEVKVKEALMEEDDDDLARLAVRADMMIALAKEKLWIPHWSKRLGHVHIMYRDDMKEIINPDYCMTFTKKPKSIKPGDFVVIVSPTRFQMEGILHVGAAGLPVINYAKSLIQPFPLLELATLCGSTLKWKGFHESNICTVPEHKGHARVHYKGDNYQEVLTKFCDLLIRMVSA